MAQAILKILHTKSRFFTFGLQPHEISPAAQIAAGTKRYQNIFDFKQGMHAMANHSIK